jgi:predicted lipid-binding transport protein (Tim44 family)
MSMTLVLAAISFFVIYKLFKTFGNVQSIKEEQVIDNLDEKSVNVSNISDSNLKNDLELIFDNVFTAFAESKHDLLKKNLSPEMYESFAFQITKRESRNLRQEICIKHIETVIEDTKHIDDYTILTVLFKVSQMSATINEEGVSFDNPQKLHIEVCHKWTFRKSAADKDQWTVIQTSIVK